MMRTYIFTLLILAVSFTHRLTAQVNCNLLTALSFTSPSLESGSAGNVGAKYRFSTVMTGVDALITITAKVNTTLGNIDVTGFGQPGRWQPEVEISSSATEGYMDFTIQFVTTGTSTPIDVSDWYASAVDVDGDGDTIRESVGFSNVETWALEDPTALALVSGPSGMKLFETTVVTNQPGILVGATEHLVYTTYRNKSSFNFRARILNAGADFSTARDRLFSLSFNPCVFDEFDDPDVLPVEWLAFNAERSQEGVVVNWITASELNNDIFQLQRSYDGLSFEEVVEIEGAGSSNQARSYTVTDETALNTQLYYRIKQVDFDGKHSFSNTIEVQKDHSILDQVTISTYPNPVQNWLHVELNQGVEAKGIRILDVNGREVISEMRSIGSSNWRLPTAELPSGAYLVQLYHQLHWTPAHKFLKQ